MVAPLHVHGGVVQKFVHDEVGRRAAVVYVADEVQLVHHEVPGQLGQGDGQVDAVAALDGGLDEGRGGAGLGGHALGGQKRSGHGAEVGGNEGVHLGQAVAAGGSMGQGRQSAQGSGEPGIGGLVAGGTAENPEGLLFRIGHYGGQLGGFPGGQPSAESVGDEGAHGARSVAQQVGEGVVLAVDVRSEQLRAPGQGQHPFQHRRRFGRLAGRRVQL